MMTPAPARNQQQLTERRECTEALTALLALRAVSRSRLQGMSWEHRGKFDALLHPPLRSLRLLGCRNAARARKERSRHRQSLR